MDYSKIENSYLKLSTQLEDLALNVGDIKEMLTKQRDDELLKRLTALEESVKEQHLKLDAINAIDINPTIVAPQAPGSVRVSGATKTKKRDDNIDDAPIQEEIVVKEDKQFSTITEYFKHLWMTNRDLLYERGVLTKEFYEKTYEDNRDKFEKKKKNEVVLQKSVAFQLWKTLPQASKDIVKAIKNQSANDLQKKNSTEIVEEEE